MMKHIFKMIWQRKRSNSLIIAEIAIAFIVVFALTLVSLRYYKLSELPLGYDYENWWEIRIHLNDWDSESDYKHVDALMSAVKQQPEIEDALFMASPVFRNWSWTSSMELDGKESRYIGNRMDDNGPEKLGMKLLAGRWFNEQDKGQNYHAVVINQLMAENLGGIEAVLGKEFGSKKYTPRKIVGVYEHFRQYGDLTEPAPYLIQRYEASAEDAATSMPFIQIKVKPGTSIVFEEKLLKTLHNIAGQWNYSVRPWELLRATHIDDAVMPLAGGAIVGVFLLIMVAMGLFGVLWQNVTRRTQEIGLRRAIGASASNVQFQIVAELVVVTLFGVAIAFAILAQLPLLGMFPELNWTLFFESFAISTVIILGIAVLCAWYPGKMAMRFEPATALHYE